MNYKLTTPRLVIDGVQAMPEQIEVVPPKKRSPALPPSPESIEAKRKRTSKLIRQNEQIEELIKENAELKKKVEDVDHVDTRNKKDLVFLAGAIDRLSKTVDKNKVKRRGLKAYVDILYRIVANHIEKFEK